MKCLSTLTAALLLVLASALALAAKPNCPDPLDHRCKDNGGGNQQFDFKVIFYGSHSIYQTDIVLDATGEFTPGKAGAIGLVSPALLNKVNFASIADAVNPCNNLTGINCADHCCQDHLLGLGNVYTAGASFFADEMEPGLVNARLWSWFELPSPYPPYEIVNYTAVPEGEADLLVHPWNPTDPDFCVPMEFTQVASFHGNPSPYKGPGHKQCVDASKYFLTCEADPSEPLPEEWDFRAIIWRAELGATPPCVE